MERLHGLDTLRAVAILLVFAYHYMLFVSHEATFGWLSECGWIGVDLFFVLSGYLIANQLLSGLARGERLSMPAFYGRRLLRTLPNFYAVLALYWMFPSAMGGSTPPPLWRFLSFTQNIGLQPGTAFSHAWSLCIEEQFYLLLPAALVAAAALTRRRPRPVWAAWALLAGLVLAGIATRTALWTRYGSEAGGHLAGYYTWVYYGTPTRLDEFLPGVAIALLKIFHPALWARITAHGNRMLLAGLAAVGVMCWLVLNAYQIEGVGYGFFMTAFGFSLIAASFAVLVVAALSPGSWLHRWRVPGAASLALWSYAIYLTHKPLAFMVGRAWEASGWPPGLRLVAIMLACLAGGWLLYRLVELPCLRLRDRLWPSSFAPRPARAGATHAVA